MKARTISNDQRASLVNSKIVRLRRGTEPRVLDLFSGCGGLMLGFHRAGCVSVGGVDIDPAASLSYAMNFHGADDRRFALHAKPKDITVTKPGQLLRMWGYSRAREAVDVLVGGPPCPTFTRVGRAKLREVNEHPEAYRLDPRAKLYVPYLKFAESLAPVAILMENVPDFLNWGGHNLAEEICDVLEDIGYRCAYTLLNAASYGVPQLRERFFLLALHSSLGCEPTFPAPSRAVVFPRGYEGSRDVALRTIREADLFSPQHRFTVAPLPGSNAPGPVTVSEAIGDLPALTGHLDGTLKRGARNLSLRVPYSDRVEPSVFAQEMRTWPAFSTNGTVSAHVTRSLSERDYRLFRLMRYGDDYPQAHRLALRLFDQHRATLVGERSRRQSDYVPPYDPAKFPNKWRKMDPSEPARTLMAHLGKDSYTHIHFDSAQARVLSVREAARLQSFPDGFEFSGTMNPAFRQIGNAVPPLLALAFAKSLLQCLDLTPSQSARDAQTEISPRFRRGAVLDVRG